MISIYLAVIPVWVEQVIGDVRVFNKEKNPGVYSFDK